MTNQVGGADAAQPDYGKQTSGAERSKAARSFEDVQTQKSRGQRKAERGRTRRKGEKRSEEAEGSEEAEAKQLGASEYAARLAQSLQGEAFGDEQFGAGEGAEGLTAELEGSFGDTPSPGDLEGLSEGSAASELRKGVRSDGRSVDTKATGAEEGADEAKFEETRPGAGTEDVTALNNQEALQEEDEELDLTSDLQQNLFASEIGNPLLAQRATEPQPVENTQATPQIPKEIVDAVVDRARFGMNAEGAHEFQIDLKQEVFQGAELKIATKDGKVSIEFVSDDPALHAAAKQLAKRLQARGLSVGGLSVSTKAEAQSRAVTDTDDRPRGARGTAGPWGGEGGVDG